jgi:hypothetical protein
MNSPFFNRCLADQQTSALQIPADYSLAVVLHPGHPKSGKKISHFLGSKFPNQKRFSSSYASRLWISYQYRVDIAGMTFASSKHTEVRTIIKNSHFIPRVSPLNTMAGTNKFSHRLRIRLLCNYLAKSAIGAKQADWRMIVSEC